MSQTAMEFRDAIRKFASLRQLSAVVLGTLLGACTTSENFDVGEDDVEPEDIHVSRVVVEDPGSNVSPKLRSELVENLSEMMARCADGPQAHTLKVWVNHFKDGDSARAFLVGDIAMLNTTNQFVDDRSGEISVWMEVDDRYALGGLLGAAAMANAAGSLSKRLGIELCEEVFDTKLDVYKVTDENW